MKIISASFLAVLGLFVVMSTGAFAANVDHSQFTELNRNFTSPEDVTKTCLTCHINAGQEIMASSHWLWSKDTANYPGKEGETISVGKKNIINNSFIGITSNESYCTSCHAGYGWSNQSFNFNDQTKIDCLICHEQSGKYVKSPNRAGYISANETNLQQAAASVGRPTNNNCGSCHFNAHGEGSGITHGDLSNALTDKTSGIVDVHMSPAGLKMNCVDCHLTKNHDIKGRTFTLAVNPKNRIECAECHTDKPHTQKRYINEAEVLKADGHYETFNYKTMLLGRETPDSTFIGRILNTHYSKVSCQACHIDRYSVNQKTKLSWDWSKAGQTSEADNTDENTVFDKNKGLMTYGQNLVPEYRLIGGKIAQMLAGNKIDPSKGPIQLNEMIDAEVDGKIWPVKIMRSKQPYDTEENTLIIPKLFGEAGSGAFFRDHDWQKAAKAGMSAAGLKFSGKMDWVDTEMILPINHMIGEKDTALACEECHSRDGRLAGVQTVGWVPGRDRSLLFDILGTLMLLGTIGGVAFHALLRYKASKEGHQ